MKNSIFNISILCFLSVFLILISCKKSVERNPEYIELSKNSIINEKGDFEFKILNGKLSFSTLSDYEKAIKFISKDKNHINYFHQYKFKSLYSDSTKLPDNCDEVLGSILNQDSEILIKELTFKLNFTNLDLAVIDEKKAVTRYFSFEDDVLGILFDQEAIGADDKKSTNMPLSCGGREKNIDWISGSDIHMKYNRAGVYFWLVGELNCGSSSQLALMTVNNESCCYKKSTGDYLTFGGSEESSYGGENVRITVYQGIRALDSFYFKAYYDLYDLYHNIIGSTYIDLGCYCNTCECVESW